MSAIETGISWLRTKSVFKLKADAKTAQIIADEAAAQLANLQAIKQAAKEYLGVSDYPHIHSDYCGYCDCDVNEKHKLDCEWQLKRDKLNTLLEAE